jgi:hypothetical protein
VTEAEWESETSSGRLIEQIRRSIKLTPKARGRKCRLAAIAMLHAFLADQEMPGLTPVMEAVERWCDDQGSHGEVSLAIVTAMAHLPNGFDIFPNWHTAVGYLDSLDAGVCLRGIASSTQVARGQTVAQQVLAPITPFVAVQCRIIREVFGNLARPLNFSPEWRTGTAMSLARQMYDSREFSAMPILADALQDAGCDNDEVLSHCRDTSLTHVRGCWVVDLVLSKG